MKNPRNSNLFIIGIVISQNIPIKKYISQKIWSSSQMFTVA